MTDIINRIYLPSIFNIRYPIIITLKISFIGIDKEEMDEDCLSRLAKEKRFAKVGMLA